MLKFFFDQKRDEDIELYNVISRYDNILTQSTTQIQSDIEIDDYLRGLKNFNVNLKMKDSENLLIPNENLINGFNGVGLVDFIADDLEYRNFPLFRKVRGKYIPSLATIILMNEIKSDLTVTDDNISFENISIAHEDGYMKIDLSKPKGLYHTHSMIDILNNRTTTDFENKIVIIFIENEMVRNVKSTYNEMHNKAEIVADSINTILKRMNRR